MPIEPRTSARVALIDDTKRVLLLGVEDPADGKRVWCLPGGGVEHGETLEQAAHRELLEEVGLEDPLDLAGPVWQGRHRFTWDGREFLQREWFFVGHIANTIPPEGIQPIGPEGDIFIGARWATVEELRSWPDILEPRTLAALLPPILKGNLPAQPIDIEI